MDHERPLLRVAAGQWNPWSNIMELGDSETYIEGPMGDILRTLSEKLDFDFQILQPYKQKWGVLLDNGTWIGMIGMILSNEVEFALGPFAMTHERNAVIDFSSPIHYASPSILTARPSLSNDIEGFLKPFSWNVWLCVLISLLIITLSLISMEKFEGRLYGFQTREVTSKSWMLALKTFAQEGSEWLPAKDGGRVLATVWLLASLVFMTSYSGILTAMLTAPRVTITIDSLEDLVSQSEVAWKIESSHLVKYFKESKEIVHQKAHQNVAPGPITSCWRAREDIANGDFAAMCIDVTIMKIMSWDFSTTGSCRMYKARKPVYGSDLNALAFRRNSPYFEEANRIIIAMTEAGMFSYWLNQRIPNTTQCLRPPSSDPSGNNERAALNIEAFGGPFFLLIGGNYLAVMILFGEKVAYYYYNYRTK